MRTLIKNAKLYDAFHHYELCDILVDDDRIEAIEPNITCEDAKKIDLTGYTVMPGFTDAHVHIATFPPDPKGVKVEHEYVPDTLLGFAANGVTLVKELGMCVQAPLEPYLEWLAGHNQADKARIVTAGRYIDVKGGYGMGPAFDGPPDWGIQIKTPEEAADAVTYQYQAGVQGIKIGISDGGMGPKAGELSHDMIRAIVRRAHSHGIWTSAHVYKAEDLWKLCECGIDEAAHTPHDRLSDELIGLMVYKGMRMTTTLGTEHKSPDEVRLPPNAAVDRQKAFEHALEQRALTVENLVRFHRAGGKISIGTDYMLRGNAMETAMINTPDLRGLFQGGMSMDDIITCATLNGAQACGVWDEGALKVHFRANLLAFSGRLSETFRELEHLPFVMNRGVVITDKRAL